MGKAGLSTKHQSILKDLATGSLTKKEIAKKNGIGAEHLSDLCSGNVKSAGVCATLFKTAYNKVLSDQTDDIKKLFKENKGLALKKLNQRLLNLLPLKATKDMTAELCQILNAMSKLAPQVEIGQMHTHYHLTQEERVDEFRRLVAATSKDDRSRLHDTVGRGSVATTKLVRTRSRRPKEE